MNLKSSEFRIGNLLQDANGRLLKVSDLNDGIQGIAFKKLERKFKTVMPISEIPLTRDNISDLGFNVCYGRSDVYELDKFKLEWEICKETGKDMFTHAVQTEYSGHCYFVHELQNLYFSIERKELVFNQTKRA